MEDSDGSRSQIDRILERTNRQSRRACRFRVEQPMETREADHVERAGNGIVHTYYGKSRIKVMKLHMTQGFPVIFPPSAEYRCFLIADSDLDYRAMRHVLLPRYQYLGPCPGFEHRNWPWILRQQLIPSCLHSAWTKITIFLALPESASNRIQGICKAPACLDDASDS